MGEMIVSERVVVYLAAIIVDRLSGTQLLGAIPAGPWEGDLVKRAGNRSAVYVLVERTSWLVLLAKMEYATAASALLGFTAKLNVIAMPLRRAI